MRAFGFVIVLLVAGISLVTLSSQANDLKPFSTDGCSMWIDGTLEQPNLWRHCCVAHDLNYWIGGTEAEREASDARIQSCVQLALGPRMADYMYSNVRWGGSPYWMSTYRWGYGWDYFDGLWMRGYKTPTLDEQQLIEQAMPAARQLIEEDAVKYPSQKIFLFRPQSQTPTQ